ncbi:Hypothetical protein OINT_1001075 [Brucella intermedia LMG 3301]|uniref:Uncharacterized protein n=1 Tax=Brucella intermedia LMG 3301 TaxID=641118 RepID=C4WHN3_9HYPH|nr:Hypothetical protein OINT_1001075 [Brucella intermedia LMG 3301]
MPTRHNFSPVAIIRWFGAACTLSFRLRRTGPITVERFLSLGFINAGLLPIAGSLHSGDCQRSRTQSPVHQTETIEFHR